MRIKGLLIAWCLFGSYGMANKVRIADRINTAPRYTDGDAVRLNNMFRGRDTIEMLTI